MMSRFLEHSMKLFMEQQAGFKSPLNTFLGTNPMTMMQNIAEQNLNMWKSMQENFYTRGGQVSEAGEDEKPEEKPKRRRGRKSKAEIEAEKAAADKSAGSFFCHHRRFRRREFLILRPERWDRSPRELRIRAGSDR